MHQSVSPGCYTMYITATGDGGGHPHAIDVPFDSNAPVLMAEMISQLIKEHFPTGDVKLTTFVTAQSRPTDEFHRGRIRERPEDPERHTNYGAYLQDVRKDRRGAEAAYIKALELNPNYVNALGNLASLRQSEELYKRALALSPGNESVVWNYANYLEGQTGRDGDVAELVDLGVRVNPQSGRLVVYRANLIRNRGDTQEALKEYARARELGADQVNVEMGHAQALHNSKAPLPEKIDAYRTAIALAPNVAELHLNLSQLLFLANAKAEAAAELSRSMRLKLKD